MPYLLFALAAGLLMQAYLGGAGFMADGAYFAAHKRFVHYVELLPMLLMLCGFLGGDKRAGWGGVAVFVLIQAQYALIYAPVEPLVRSLHVANGILAFGIAVFLLARRSPLCKAP